LKTAISSSYASLRKQVRGAILAGRKRAEKAVESEKVHTVWEIGKLILEHVLGNQERADYAAYVIKRLAADLGMSRGELYFMVEFARAYPIVTPAGQLSWSHYRDLLSINDPEKRRVLAERAQVGKWTRKRLRREMPNRRKKGMGFSGTPFEDTPLLPKKGKLGTYRVVLAEAGPDKGKPVLDLGFSNYYRMKGKRGTKPFYVTGTTLKNLKKMPKATEADIYTYRAYVTEVTDGDTFWALVDLGFGITTLQKLRLRGIDAPEVASSGGRKAKKFVEKALDSAPYFSKGRKPNLHKSASDTSPVIISTSKSDKYDRYLCDVFVGDLYLNQALLDQRLATRVE